MTYKQQIKQLNSIKSIITNELSNELSNIPDGSIQSHMNKGKFPQYWLVTRDSNGYIQKRYLRKSEVEIARRIIQKDYDLRLLRLIQHIDNHMIHSSAILSDIDFQNFIINSFLDLYDKIPEPRKILITPHFTTNEVFLDKWYLNPPAGGNKYPITKPSTTERGEIVRSKSEKTIADKLFYRNIPYKYEAPLKINRQVLYPDFTLLNIRTRKTIYLEHFGLMDDSDYCKRALEKIETYASVGILEGDRLLITMESSQKALNPTFLDSLIDKYLL